VIRIKVSKPTQHRIKSRHQDQKEEEMMRSVANRQIAIAAIVALLSMSLPSLSLPQTQVSGNTFQQKVAKRLAIESQVFERKGLYGEVVARLSVSPAESPNRVQFQIEDLQRGERCTGTVEVKPKALKIRFKDEGSKTRLGLDIQHDQTSASSARITLRHNKKQHNLTIDGEKSRTVGGQMRTLVEQGNQLEAARLIPEFRKAFTGAEEYKAFVDEVASSPGSGILQATASLKASLSSEEVRQNLPLHLIGFAANMLAPSSMKKYGKQIESRLLNRAQPPRVVKTSYNPGALTATAALKPASQAEVCCDHCVPIFLGLLFGCIDMYFWCLSWTWDDPWGDPWLCWVLEGICEAGAWGFLIWCGDICYQGPC
jgi:hypothetical protein